MHKLGEQWVEEIDGKEHMLKAVKRICIYDGKSIDGYTCHGCSFVDNWDDDCTLDNPPCLISQHTAGDFIIKDLGILNEDGCLKSDFGIYPAIYRHVIMGVNGYMVKACATDPYVGKYAWGKTKQEAIDAWNRRV